MPRPEVISHLSRLYAECDDPWNHRTSDYEARKYAQSLDAIGPGPFHHGLEIGCGIGELSRRLAARCRRLTAVDCIPKAAEAAQSALAHLDHVQVILGTAPRDLPQIQPDLVVLSEVLYFLTPKEIRELASWIKAHCRGSVVAVNWTGDTDEDLTGHMAAELLAAHLLVRRTLIYPNFRVDLFHCNKSFTRSQP